LVIIEKMKISLKIKSFVTTVTLLLLSSSGYAANAQNYTGWRFFVTYFIFGLILYVFSFAFTPNGKKKIIFYAYTLRLLGSIWFTLSLYDLTIPGIIISGAVGTLAPPVIRQGFSVVSPFALRFFHAIKAIFVSDPKGIEGSVTYSPRGTSIATTFLLYAMYGHLGAAIILMVYFPQMDIELMTQVGTVIDIAGLVFVLVYFARLRIIVSPESITKKTLFGSTTVALTGSARVKYGFVFSGLRLKGSRAVHGAEVNAFGAIENGGKRISISRYMQNSNEIIEILISFEKKTITPYLLDLIKSGQSIDSGPLSQTLDEVKVGWKTIRKPLKDCHYDEKERLVIQSVSDEKRTVRIHRSNVWNPETTLELLRYIDLTRFEKQKQV